MNDSRNEAELAPEVEAERVMASICATLSASTSILPPTPAPVVVTLLRSIEASAALSTTLVETTALTATDLPLPKTSPPEDEVAESASARITADSIARTCTGPPASTRASAMKA